LRLALSSDKIERILHREPEADAPQKEKEEQQKEKVTG